MSDFNELLNQCSAASQGTYETAEEFEDWFPPNGEYGVIGKKPRFNTFVSKKNQATYGIINLPCELLDGEHEGKVFEKGFFANSKSDMAALKSLVALQNGGEVPSNYADVIRILINTWEGTTAKVSCHSQVQEDGSPDRFPKVKFLEVLEEVNAS